MGLSIANALQHRLLHLAMAQPYRLIIAAQKFPSDIYSKGTEAQQIRDSDRELTANYASMWAGAHVRPIPASSPQLKREAAWLRTTATHFGTLVEKKSNESGISKVRGIEFLEAPSEEYAQQTKEKFEQETGLGGYRAWRREEMPEGIELGFEYETYCVNPVVYCSWLMKKFQDRGGTRAPGQLLSIKQAFSLVDDVRCVINASGTGFNDPKSYYIRGEFLPSIFSQRRPLLKRWASSNRSNSNHRFHSSDENSNETE